MNKYKVTITRIEHYEDHIEIAAKNEIEANEIAENYIGKLEFKDSEIKDAEEFVNGIEEIK